jgi:hypothetical protein
MVRSRKAAGVCSSVRVIPVTPAGKRRRLPGVNGRSAPGSTNSRERTVSVAGARARSAGPEKSMSMSTVEFPAST